MKLLLERTIVWDLRGMQAEKVKFVSSCIEGVGSCLETVDHLLLLAHDVLLSVVVDTHHGLEVMVVSEV